MATGGGAGYNVGGPPSGGGGGGGSKKGGTSKALVGLALAGGVFGLASLFGGKKKSDSPSSSISGNTPELAPPPDLPTSDYISMSFPDFGGPSQTLTPVITGIANLKNLGGPIPVVFGQNQMYPPLAAQFVNISEGGQNYALGLFCLGPGPVSVTKIQIGTIPIASYGSDVAYQLLPGDDPVNEHITLYSQDFSNLTPNVALRYNVAKVLSNSKIATRITAEVSCPGGLYQKDVNGNSTAATIAVNLEYRLAGSSDAWTHVDPDTGSPSDPTLTITDNSSSVVKRSITWTPAAVATYEIRFTRQTADSTSALLVNACQVSLIRAYGSTPSVNPRYDSTGTLIPMAYIAVRIRATDTLNGNLNQLNCQVTSKLPVWNGSAWTTGAPVATRNPAWIVARILTGPANRRPISLSDLDGNAFKVWADWCDANSRYFDFIFDQVTTVPEAATQVARAGRAALIWADGKYSVAVDKLRTTVVQHFTPRNSSQFEMKQTRPDVIHGVIVKFLYQTPNVKVGSGVNPPQQTERIVYADGYSSDGANGTTVARKFQSISLVGCTTPTQAWKDGRYYLAVSKLRRRTFTLYTDIEHLACNRYDMVRLSHDVPLLGIGWARVASVALNGAGDHVISITCDDAFEMQTGSDYCVRYRTSAGVTDVQNLVTEPGTTATLTFSTPIATSGTAPAVGDLIMFGLQNSESIEAIVHSIEYQSDGNARLTLVDHAPGVFTAESGTIPDFNPQVTIVHSTQQVVAQPIILSVVSDQSVLLRDIDGSYTSRIQIALQAPAASVAYFQTQLKRSDAQTWGASHLTPASQGLVNLSPVSNGQDYDVRIRAVSYDSYLSDWTTITGHTVIGTTTLPPDIPRLDLSGDLLNLHWYYDASVGVTPPPDLAGFRVKIALGQNTNWTAGTTIIDLTLSTTLSITRLPAGELTIMVKAVDVAGNESENAAVLRYNFGTPETSNVVLEYPEAPDFTGTITNGSVSGGVLEANDASGLAWLADDTQQYWQADDSATFWSLAYLALTYEWSHEFDNSLIPTGTIAPLLSMLLTQQSESFALLYRTGGNSLYWDTHVGADSLPFWDSDDASNAWADDDPYVPMPAQIPAKIQRYDFKAEGSASHSYQAQISAATLVVDVPDVTEKQSNVIISSSNTLVAATKTYREITSVQLTLVQDPGYPNANTVRLVSVSAAGPVIAVFDTSGVQVAGVVNVKMEGY